MLESVMTTLDKFTPEILVILTGLLVITTTLFLWLWFANRRTYNLLKHQLPASVVKSYLDSVIQNSNSLKSALFRGNSAELGTLPTITPVLGGGDNLLASGAGDAALREQLQQKLAELAAMQAQLAAAQNVKRDLEKTLSGAQERIKELEALLAKAGPGGSDAALAGELQKVSKERDDLREKLKEYEIIEDDLANLKRLQQENQQLKRSLGSSDAPMAAGISGGSEQWAKETPVMEADNPIASAASDLFEDVPAKTEEDATNELEEFLTSGTEEQASDPEKAVESALTKGAAKSAGANEKTPEDLLSEFEKMLG